MCGYHICPTSVLLSALRECFRQFLVCVPNSCTSADLQRPLLAALLVTAFRTFSDVFVAVQAMHRAFEISPDAPMEDAADMVVRKRAHRICVVDSEGVLLGVVSRGDIMRATIATFQAYMDKQDAKSATQQSASGTS